MDALDKKILTALRTDGRTQLSRLARDLAMGDTMLRGRVERMVQSGVIRRFTVETDLGVYGHISALLYVTASAPDPDASQRLERDLISIDGVGRLYKLMGQPVYILEVSAASLGDLDRLARYEVPSVDFVLNVTMQLVSNTLV